MKKLVIMTIAAGVTMVMSSCELGYICPTYSEDGQAKPTRNIEKYSKPMPIEETVEQPTEQV